MASSRFRTTLAEELRILAARVVGQDERPDQDLPGALIRLEQAVASQIGAMTNADVVAQVGARLALYQQAVPLLMEMAGMRLEDRERHR